jgi:pimeloyl-ACP methyl ester carboxylesterase
VFALLFVSKALPETLAKRGIFAGLEVDYKVVLPNGCDLSRVYPVLLVFPGATQSMRGVTGELERWTREALRRGYILVSPAAPTEQTFFESSDRIFPDFLDMILRDYKVLGGRIHVAGGSNGGVSAFHVASLYPKIFLVRQRIPGVFGRHNGPDCRSPQAPMYLYARRRARRRLAEGHETAIRHVPSKGLFLGADCRGESGRYVDFGPENTVHFFDDLDAAAKGCSK